MQFHSVRGGRGVQMEEVWAAADTVLAQGERPTIERVRQQLGRGSPNTVGPMLDGWYGSLAKRLGAGPVEDAGAGAEADTLPAPVLRAAKALWARALQQSQEHAAHGLAAAQANVDAQAQTLSAERDALAQDAQRLKDRTEALAAAMQAKDQQISNLARQLEEMQQMLALGHAEIEALRRTQAEQAAAAQLERQNGRAKDEDHRKERERLEQRATAQERRLLEEIDRARQDAKRVAAQWAEDAKKSAKTLADEQDRAKALEVQSSALQSENAGLTRELAVARDEIYAARTQNSELGREAAQLLQELRTHLPTPRRLRVGSAKTAVQPLRRGR
ncbi:DNA-binding protein [Acidovorax sp. 106]|uniref:DNA-binding protein n=1 Tax=Acidovorax sp. 106 TaxID=2135637 RepID=UPI000EB3A8CD|nr:DNA-binding protein [Acidovorax sp. 106]RLJ40059.1 plasmid replication DNA-binding protein KfrA [Acidovorax sp. 106]